jgi:hypothetical protein
VVPHPDRPTEELKAAPPPSVDPQEDEDGFVVVRNKDSFAALSDFLAQMMLQHPEINQLSPEQLRAMIEGSMSHLKEPSTVGKLWQVSWQERTNPAAQRAVSVDAFSASLI